MVEFKIVNKSLLTEEYYPKYATSDSAGIDLYACIDNPIDIPPLQVRMIHTGIAINMQAIKHCAALIIPRSGKGHKEGKVLGNTIGVIDSDYHGELLVSLWNRNPNEYVTIKPMEKFVQLVIVPVLKPKFELVNNFSTSTERGAGGFGSTGS